MIKKAINKFNRLFFKFTPKIENNSNNIIHIGTEYGGYDICDENLSHPTIISCGLGEDASFDIDMINRFGAKILCIDPTPRSLEYFKKIKKRFGKQGNEKFNESGLLDVEIYDLRNTTDNNFKFINKAIWSENDKDLKLYFPKNLNFVSLSINKKKDQYDDKNYILSKTITYQQIIKDEKLNKVDILKLDIEGAEIDVINNLLEKSKQLLPNQLIVEFDIRRKPSYKSFIDLNKIHNKIKNYYKLVNINPKGDFTYLRIK